VTEVQFTMRRSRFIGLAQRKKRPDGTHYDSLTLYLSLIHRRAYNFETYEQKVLRTLILADFHERLHAIIWNELGKGWFFSGVGRKNQSKPERRKENFLCKITDMFSVWLGVIDY
jgi:hypothetical protein